MSIPYDFRSDVEASHSLSQSTYVKIGGSRFVRPTDDIMGTNIHRSGWADCVRELRIIETRVVLDDFVEQTMLLGPTVHYHTEPFVGFFHHPPDNDIPSFAKDHHATSFERLFSSEAWERSKHHLVGAICLSEHLKRFLEPYLDVPVYMVRHPTETSAPIWSPRSFQERPRVVQVGAFYRNTLAICEVATEVEKVRFLNLNNGWMRGWDDRIKKELGTDFSDHNVHHINRVTNEKYDHFLSTSVILTEFLAASASNVVVECMARCTPIIVNRNAAVVEYLGEDYPLYSDVVHWGRDELIQTAVEAHLYLADRRPIWLEPTHFLESVSAILSSLRVPHGIVNRDD